MNLRDLEYLVAIADARSFRKAAEICHATQPTLSGQLRKLEDYLGVQLVERTQRTVQLTEVGQEVVGRARRVLHEAAQIEEIAQTFSNPYCGKVRLGLIHTVAPYLLPKIMPALKQHFPALEFFLFEAQTHQLLERLRQTQLDAIVLALPVDEHGLEVLSLVEEPFWLAVSENHTLARKEKINETDLRHENILLLEDGHCLRDQALYVCMHAGATGNQGFQGTSLETLRHMVANETGVTLMPEFAVPLDQEAWGAVRYLPFESPPPIRTLGLLYRKSSRRDACFRSIAEQMRPLLQRSLSTRK
jgi:LysR family hydrogen peroxide-inducible transcriptional activator